jgi:DHA3 family macrolide efflux protein-like MFS transporter
MSEKGERTPGGRWQGRFFPIWSGQQVSLLGSQAAQFALVWWLTTTTGSATVLASASLVALLPQLLVGPIAGVFIDRWSRRRTMIVADAAIALVSLTLAILFWTGAMRVWHVYLVLLARSLGAAFHWPAMTAATSLLVPKEYLTRVAGLNQTMQGVVMIAGPGLGALLVSLLPLHGIMFVDVGTALFGIGPLLFVAIPELARREHAAAGLRSLFADLAAGFAYVRAWRGLVLLSLLVLAAKLAMTPAFSLLPLLVRKVFGRGADAYGAVEMIFGLGIVAGGTLLSVWGGSKRKVVTALLGFLLLGGGFAVVGAAPVQAFWVVMAGCLILGFSIPLVDGPFFAILQGSIDPSMQGRVFSLLGTLFNLTSPLGLLAAGPLSDVVGLRVWYLAAGALCVAGAVLGLATPAILHLEEEGRRNLARTQAASLPVAVAESIPQGGAGSDP